MLRWLIFVFLTILTVLTGVLVTWQFNDQELSVDDQQVINEVRKKMGKSPMRYVVVRYNVEWENDMTAVVSGKTIYNIPVVTAEIGAKQVR